MLGWKKGQFKVREHQGSQDDQCIVTSGATGAQSVICGPHLWSPNGLFEVQFIALLLSAYLFPLQFTHFFVLSSFPSSNTTDKKLHIISRPALDGPEGTRDASRSPSLEEVTDGAGASPAPGSPKFPSQDEGSSSNILIYVSVLAAVVLGLLLYVAYKW